MYTPHICNVSPAVVNFLSRNMKIEIFLSIEKGKYINRVKKIVNEAVRWHSIFTVYIAYAHWPHSTSSGKLLTDFGKKGGPSVQRIGKLKGKKGKISSFFS